MRPTLYRLQSPRRQITTGTGIHSKNGPTQAELLKFALKKDAHITSSRPNTRQHLTNIYLKDWPPDSSPVPLWIRQPRGVDRYFENRENALSRLNDLQGLQAFVEGNVISSSGDAATSKQFQVELRRVLEKCERHNTYGEILSFINGLNTRLGRLDSKKDPYIHVLGMQYACLALSKSSLIRHLLGYLSMTDEPLDLENSNSLVRSLLSSLHTSSLQDPKSEPTGLLRLVTGEDEPDSPNLNQILCWGRPEFNPLEIGGYLSLLFHSRSDAVRHEKWNKYLEQTVGNMDPAFQEFRSAYEYALTLVNAGDSAGALDALKQVSKCAGNNLPGISMFSQLARLIEDDTISQSLGQIAGKQEYLRILDTQMNRIEQRLGVIWDPDQGLHIGASDARDVSDQPLLTMDGDSAGYKSHERLVAEIQARGSSKYSDDLRKMAGLLDEYEGDMVEVSVPLWTDSGVELYWSPQRSPAELSLGSDSEPNRATSDLGLVKVTAKGQSHFAHAPNLHLMQLGLLYSKELVCADADEVLVEKDIFSFMKDGDDPHQKDMEVYPEQHPTEQPEHQCQLQETGYLVTWDRASSRFLIVFIGKGRRRITPTEEIQLVSALQGPGGILEMYPHSIGATNPGSQVRIPSYYIELDPSHDLIPKPKPNLPARRRRFSNANRS
ncbi:hypothetical protein BDV18DRAFT_162224 [Aspergillus unguis]